MGEYKEGGLEGGLEVRLVREEGRREVNLRKIEVEGCKVRVEREEECKVVGLELQAEKEEDRGVADDPGEAGMFVGNEAEAEGEVEGDL